jgi:peptide deformylase|tara:strand:- start:103 stop:648 length:546 start_codon:yes stop_codon:yes gene_type:complete
MSILKISRLGNPILLQKCKPVKDITADSTKQIIHDMTETMLDAKGIGLAAPQVHINQQIIIFRNPEDEQDKEIKITALINPKLIKIDDQTDNQWEGCLSIPGMLGLVKRFSKVRYEGYDMQGSIIKKEAEGLHARVVQHEYDHLMGILYINRLAHKNAYGFSDEIEEYWKGKEESGNSESK